MISTAPLEQPLVADSLRELQPFDEELERVLSLVARDEFYAAAEAAAALWTAGFYDVRVLGCYLYGVYLDRSLPSLAVITDCLVVLLDSSWSFLAPKESRARDLAVALRWLFAQILRDVQYNERIRSERWKGWQDAALIVAFAAGAQGCGRLLAAMGRRQVPESCRSALVYLQSMMGQLGRAPAESSGWTLPPPRTGPEPVRFASQEVQDWKSSPVDSEAERSTESRPESSDSEGESAPSIEGEEESERSGAAPGDGPTQDRENDKDKESDTDKENDRDREDEKDREENKDADSDKEQNKAAELEGTKSAESTPTLSAVQTASPPAASAQAESVVLKVSPALHLLLRRIEIFQRLVGRRRYRAAAIVLRDLLQCFRTFDPRVFLPSLVAPLFTALRPHEKALGPLLAEPQTVPAEDALLSLYLCDLDLFVQAAEDER